MQTMEIRDFDHAVSLAASAQTPLHIQLADFVRSKIRSGAFKPGDQMIPENDLCTALHISRTTVRQSMEALVEEGLLIRYRRRGSFIADQKMKRPISSLYNFSGNMRQLNVVPSSQVLVSSVQEADADVRGKLQLKEKHAQVFLLKRLRCADGKPILVETTYVPYSVCPGIEQHDYAVTSLYQVLAEEYAAKVVHATETIAAILIREEEAKLLKCKSRDAGYQISRVSETRSGQLIEYTTSITRADMCEFTLELYDAPEHSAQRTNVIRSISVQKH